MAFGASAFGTDGAPIYIESARVIALNALALRLFPDSVPGLQNPMRADSVFHWRNWSILGTNGEIRLVRAVSFDDSDGELSVILDGTLKPGVPYDVSCVGIDGAFRVVGLAVQAASTQLREREQIIQDWAKPERAADTQGGSIGTFQVVNGDLALTSGAASLRERVIRIVQTTAGQMAHDPTYGMAWRIGSLLTVDALQRYQSRLLAQIKRDPDVARANVTVGNVPEYPGVVSVLVNADTVDGSVSVATRTQRT